MMFDWQGKYFIIYRDREFWTGFAWTDTMQFAKPYEFNEGLAILERRFHRLLPTPKLRHCEAYKERELAAERAAQKKKDKAAERQKEYQRKKAGRKSQSKV